jgi:preprotein translocase subunit SecD
MTRLAKALAAVPLLLSCFAPVSWTGLRAQGPAVRFEVRKAEDKAAKGLQEATVEGTQRKVYLHKGAALTSLDVAGARATADGAGNPAVEVRFSGEGRKKFAALTAEHEGKPLAILFEGKVIAAPVVRGLVADGKALITGAFSKEEAERIAGAFRSK